MNTATHEHLSAIIEVQNSSYLWTPDNSITFTPKLLQKIYGDGRALFTISTMNQRPAYWVIRGCSTWKTDSDTHEVSGPSIREFIDEILTDLEEEFGDGLCGYSANSLFFEKEERNKYCSCDECAGDFVATWPMVNWMGGCSWGRMKWPDGFETEPSGYVLIKEGQADEYRR